MSKIIAYTIEDGDSEAEIIGFASDGLRVYLAGAGSIFRSPT
jgi:hypothetical protein